MGTVVKAAVGTAVLVGVFLLGVRQGDQHEGTTAASSRRVLKYVCPMHPQYTSDHPGIAPCCGMQLVPVYADGAGAVDAAVPELPGTVRVTAERQQLLGIRLATARRTSGKEYTRLLGRVVADKSRVYKLTVSVDGWVREIEPPAVGSLVRKGDLLAKIFSREVLTPQQGLVYALTTRDRMRREANNTSNNADAAALQIYTAEQNLLAMGISETQIEELSRNRSPQTTFELRAPIDGLILTRSIELGVRTNRDLELYRLADLRRIWVLAEVYERESALIRHDAPALVHYQGKTIHATVSGALPDFDPETRVLKQRLEMDNPGLLLRPDMFVDVDLPVELPPAVTVPLDAVINSGVRKTVYVKRGESLFEPQAVETGWQIGDRIAITKGLSEGDEVVVDGSFLVDSESRMRFAAFRAGQDTEAALKDPVCGMDVDPSRRITAEYQGRTYHFCSATCKKDFQKDPKRYLGGNQGGAAPGRGGAAL